MTQAGPLAVHLRLLDLSYDSPALNLALDEVLLEGVEEGRSPDTLRIWESPAQFVVLGTSQKLADHVHLDTCRRDGVGVFRRCSAGGCVLQGPGSLNFSLALATDATPEIRTLHSSYCYILGKLSRALASRGVPASHRGISDMAIGDLKVSGNAQRRRRRAILHHGTLLYAPDIAAMERYLPDPADRPDYRGPRNHAAFVGQIPLSKAMLREALCAAFGVRIEAAAPPAPWEWARAEQLAREKYASDAWTFRR